MDPVLTVRKRCSHQYGSQRAMLSGADSSFECGSSDGGLAGTAGCSILGLKKQESRCPGATEGWQGGQTAQWRESLAEDKERRGLLLCQRVVRSLVGIARLRYSGQAE